MKKVLPIIVIAIIVIVIIVLTTNKPSGNVVITETGEQISTGIIKEPADAGVEVGILAGNKAPNFVLESFDGELVELAEINKPIVIDFWAGWCPFCIEELPELQAVYEKYGDQVEFLGIHRSETESVGKGLGFAEELGVTYPLLKDMTGDVYDIYSGGQPFMPVAYFIDSDGIIVERVLGPKTGERIESSVEVLLNK